MNNYRGLPSLAPGRPNNSMFGGLKGTTTGRIYSRECPVLEWPRIEFLRRLEDMAGLAVTMYIRRTPTKAEQLLRDMEEHENGDIPDEVCRVFG